MKLPITVNLMPTQSLPTGDTTSPTALGSGTHTDTQHTVTGECVHYWCAIKAMAMKHTSKCYCSVLLSNLVLLAGGKSLWYRTSSMEC